MYWPVVSSYGGKFSLAVMSDLSYILSSVFIGQLENVHTIELLKYCSLEVSDEKLKLMT